MHVCGRRFLPNVSSSTCKYFIMSQEHENKASGSFHSWLDLHYFAPDSVPYIQKLIGFCCYRDMWDVSLKHDTEVSQRFNYMDLLSVLCACGIFFLYWVGTEFSCGWQFNPLQFSKWLDLFSTRFQQMWLDLWFSHSQTVWLALATLAYWCMFMFEQ